jgi:hypothetical protein
MLDAGAGLGDVRIAARHADPRSTMRYDRARKNLDRHPNHVLGADMASGTWGEPNALSCRCEVFAKWQICALRGGDCRQLLRPAAARRTVCRTSLFSISRTSLIG